MKPNELIGAKVVAIQGKEGFGCERCRVPPGRPEYKQILLKLPDGTICELTVERICPPDMDTGYRKQRMVAMIQEEAT